MRFRTIFFMRPRKLNAGKGNTSEIILAAHTIKGQCMNVEMKNVVSIAGQIEVLAMKNSLTQLLPLLPVLKKALAEGLEALQVALLELTTEKVA